MSEEVRERWGSRLGFLLAAIGSAVGLGNMWRFSYLTAEHGGAAFVVLYLVMTAAVGLPVMLAEFVVGRGSGKSPIAALAHYGGRGWKPLGALFVASGFLILAYYSVIAGWTVRYAVAGIVSGFGGDAAQRFSEVATGGWAVFWHLLFMGSTVAVVMGGIHGGIERVAVLLMPLLFVIVVALAAYAATLPGASAGYAFFLHTSFEKILSFEVLKDAAGQAFFSLSLGMGAMLTFASYLDRSHHLPNEALVVASSDFLVAFVAGLVVFPVLFALGLQREVGASTLGALFITLPDSFAHMGAAGRPIGVLFFAVLVVGALTSAVSLLEVVVASAMDGLGWSRRTASLALGAAIAALGIPAALDTGVLGLMDQIAGNVFLLIGGLALSLFVGFVMRDPIEEVRAGTHGIRWFFLWRGLLRYAVPLVLAVVLVYSVRDTIGAIAGFVSAGG